MSEQTPTVKQHAVKEVKLAAKIALCFLSAWFILLIWALKGVYWGLVSSIIPVFTVVIILMGRRRIYSIIQRFSTYLEPNNLNAKSNPNSPKKE
ncbi:hypothetical protein FJZ31_07530 [Candidatus Poribacteria bacterium]|nr:hypothetical protein [Candidatus Poribacteria bacterium]